MLELQPHLSGKLVSLRPLAQSDFEALYAVAADPLIWELHPENTRYQRKVFEKFFQAAMDSKGALIVSDLKTGEVIGSSRYTGFIPEKSQIEVGYTFLSRSCWGKGHNSEMKQLMLGHAFQFVDHVHFFIGEENHRSRKAVEKLSAKLMDRIERKPLDGNPYFAVVYELSKPKN
jgi:RimJ/RimL family protein N-acetyltransferase